MTKRQSEVLKYIKDYCNKNGHSPSIRDMCAGLDIKSTAQIAGILKSLREQGKITYIERRARTIEVL